MDPNQAWWMLFLCVVSPGQHMYSERVRTGKHPFEVLGEMGPNAVLLNWRPISREELDLYLKLTETGTGATPMRKLITDPPTA